MYYSRVGTEDESGIWRVRADFSGDPELVFVGEGLRPTGFHPEGTVLLLERASGPGLRSERDILALDLDAEELSPIVARAEVNENNAEFSPDGRFIAYASNETGTQQVYLRASDGAQLWLVSPDRGGSPKWAPDGSGLYYDQFRGAVFFVPIAFGAEVVIGTPIRHQPVIDSPVSGG